MSGYKIVEHKKATPRGRAKSSEELIEELNKKIDLLNTALSFYSDPGSVVPDAHWNAYDPGISYHLGEKNFSYDEGHLAWCILNPKRSQSPLAKRIREIAGQ